MSILITADEARAAIQNSCIMNATGGISDARSHVLSLQSNAHADESIELIVQHLESAQTILQGLRSNGII